MNDAADEPPAESTPVRRRKLVQYFFFGTFLLLLWQVLRILSPFYIALIGSALLSLIVYPLHDRVFRLLRKHRNTAAACTTTLVALIIVLPIVLFSWVLVKEAVSVAPVSRQWVDSTQKIREKILLADVPQSLLPIWETTSNIFDALKIDPKEILFKNVNELSTTMTGMASHMIKNTVLVIFNLVILIFTMFFFLRDGPDFIRHLVELIPLDPEHKGVIIERIQVTLYAVIRGMLVVAMIHGVLAGVGFALFDVPFPVLLGALTALLAPIPLIGGSSIWILVACGLILDGSYSSALHVALWNMTVVAVVDHFLRPILISQEAKLPMILLFFGMLGGLHVYGVTDLLVGPVIMALLLAFIDIYRREYRWLARDAKEI